MCGQNCIKPPLLQAMSQGSSEVLKKDVGEMSEKKKKTLFFLPLFNPPMFPWFTLLRRLTFMYFTRALIYFWCCFTMARIKKWKKIKKNIDGQFTYACGRQACY